ncbi:MAG: hypothetical protein IJQ53_00420 [Clostridia bacterium]|nr:hypothetical protein [Clostridia bacterium]
MDFQLHPSVSKITSPIILRVKSKYSDTYFEHKYNNGYEVSTIIFTDEYEVKSVKARDNMIVLSLIATNDPGAMEES